MVYNLCGCAGHYFEPLAGIVMQREIGFVSDNKVAQC